MNAEVLRPLGMMPTVLDIDVARTREHAIPHSRTLTFEAQPLATETERGTWTNPRLGRIDIRRDAGGFTLDAGEWRAPIGEHKINQARAESC